MILQVASQPIAERSNDQGVCCCIVQVNLGLSRKQPTFVPNNEIEGNTGSQANLLSQYKEIKLQTSKTYQEHYPQIRGSTRNKEVVLSALDQRENTSNLAFIQPNFNQSKSREDYKASQIKLKLDEVNMIDKINLHRKIG